MLCIICMIVKHHQRWFWLIISYRDRSWTGLWRFELRSWYVGKFFICILVQWNTVCRSAQIKVTPAFITHLWSNPTNTEYRPNDCQTPGQRLRRWPGVWQTLGDRVCWFLNISHYWERAWIPYHSCCWVVCVWPEVFVLRQWWLAGP